MGKRNKNKNKNKDTDMTESEAANITTTMDVETQEGVEGVDAQGRNGTGCEEYYDGAERYQAENLARAIRQHNAFGKDNYETIMSDHTKKGQLTVMVDLIVDTVFGETLDPSTIREGSMELGKALVAGHIFSLDALAGIDPKTLTVCIRDFGPGLCHGAVLVAKFIGLDKKHGVCEALGLNYNTVTCDVVRNVVISYDRMQDNPIPENKSFMLASMSGGNVFDVMESFHRFLIENDLMELESEDAVFELGEHFFQNAWIARKLAQWMYRTSNHHTVQKMIDSSKKNGMAIWRKLCEVYLTGKSKENLTKTLVQKCENLRLYRIKDAHCFFNAFDWYVSAINRINGGRSDYWDETKQDAKLREIFGQCSGNSLVKDHGLSLAFATANKDDADISKIRKEISELWVTWKLNDAGDQPTLPENFFPKTLDISTYVQTQKKIEGGEANCPAADDAHAAKRLQSDKDKKSARNQAQNLQIFRANVGGGYGNWNHQGGHNSGENTANPGSKNKDGREKSVSFNADGTSDKKSAGGGNKDNEGNRKRKRPKK